MKKATYLSALIALSTLTSTGFAAEISVAMSILNESGENQAIGNVVFSETPYGLVFSPQLSKLPSGIHGFHVHENPSCNTLEKDGKKVLGLAAGGHLDPEKSGKHGTPWGNGHLGDLPPLFVDTQGNATVPVLAPRLTLAKVQNRSLMIHVGGDNHADHPAPLGGGGARLACGVIR